MITKYIYLAYRRKQYSSWPRLPKKYPPMSWVTKAVSADETYFLPIKKTQRTYLHEDNTYI